MCLVTGGSGFLGTPTIGRFESYDVADVIAPRSEEYDLREREAIRAVLADTAPDVVVHLAAVVGGIGANMATPGQFFYDNAIMGIQLIEAEPSRRGFALRLRRHRLRLPEARPGAVPARTNCGTATPRRRTPRMGSQRRCSSSNCRRIDSSTGSTAIYLLPVNLYGPRDNFDARTLATSFRR